MRRDRGGESLADIGSSSKQVTDFPVAIVTVAPSQIWTRCGGHGLPSSAGIQTTCAPRSTAARKTECRVLRNGPSELGGQVRVVFSFLPAPVRC